MKQRCIRIVGLLSLVLPSLFAEGGPDRAIRRAGWADPLGGRLAIADFDRDQKADGAVVLRPELPRPAGRYRVEVHFSGRPSLEFTVHFTGGAVALEARDIDQDHDSDLVVTQRFTAKGVKVWINDGKGGFQEGRLEDYPGLSGREPLTLQAPGYASSSPAGLRQTTRSDSADVFSGAVLRPPDCRRLSRTLAGHVYRGAGIHGAGRPRAPPSVSTV